MPVARTVTVLLRGHPAYCAAVSRRLAVLLLEVEREGAGCFSPSTPGAAEVTVQTPSQYIGPAPPRACFMCFLLLLARRTRRPPVCSARTLFVSSSFTAYRGGMRCCSMEMNREGAGWFSPSTPGAAESTEQTQNQTSARPRHVRVSCCFCCCLLGALGGPRCARREPLRALSGSLHKQHG